eukprot:2315398-Pyramimonas_sp.AAC.1
MLHIRWYRMPCAVSRPAPLRSLRDHWRDAPPAQGGLDMRCEASDLMYHGPSLVGALPSPSL